VGKRTANTADLIRAVERAIKDDTEQMEKEVAKAKKNVLRTVGQYGVTRFRDLIQEYCYDKMPTSEWYDRMGESGGFLDTISYRTHGDKIEIYCDWTKLQRRDNGDRQYPSHASIIDGKKFTEGIWEYYINGRIHYIYDKHNNTTQVHDDWEQAIMNALNNELQQYSNEMVQKALTSLFGNRLSDMYTQTSASMKHGRHSHR